MGVLVREFLGIWAHPPDRTSSWTCTTPDRLPSPVLSDEDTEELILTTQQTVTDLHWQRTRGFCGVSGMEAALVPLARKQGNVVEISSGQKARMLAVQIVRELNKEVADLGEGPWQEDEEALASLKPSILNEVLKGLKLSKLIVSVQTARLLPFIGNMDGCVAEMAQEAQAGSRQHTQ